MSLPVSFLPEARQEYDDAVDWYEKRRPGLGADFIARVRQAIQPVAANPQLHAVVYKDVRKAVVRQFPYILIYKEEVGELLLVAVFHTSRDPAIWQARV